MVVRRLAETQPDSFAFSDENAVWAQNEISKYPEGRQASAVISLLWRAQEQERWVSEPAIATVAAMLDMPNIRVLEIATFYTMFQLEPVGTVAHIQVCGTTPCWLRGADAIKDVCSNRISKHQHQLSENGAFSWEEVECLGACVNAPLVQIGADTFEDLDAESFAGLLDNLAAGRDVRPGPQIERAFSEPEGGPTSLREIPVAPEPIHDSASDAQEPGDAPPASDQIGTEPAMLSEARSGGSDDLKRISGVGPKLEGVLNDLGIYHFDQIAAWTPEHIVWVDERLKFKGRIERDGWLEQAEKFTADDAKSSDKN